MKAAKQRTRSRLRRAKMDEVRAFVHERYGLPVKGIPCCCVPRLLVRNTYWKPI